MFIGYPTYFSEWSNYWMGSAPNAGVTKTDTQGVTVFRYIPEWHENKRVWGLMFLSALMLVLNLHIVAPEGHKSVILVTAPAFFLVFTVTLIILPMPKMEKNIDSRRMKRSCLILSLLMIAPAGVWIFMLFGWSAPLSLVGGMMFIYCCLAREENSRRKIMQTGGLTMLMTCALAVLSQLF